MNGFMFSTHIVTAWSLLRRIKAERYSPEKQYRSEGNVLLFAEFKSKFQLKKTTFLHFFQVISAIPSHLLQRARELKISLDDSKFYDDSASFQINENSYLDLMKAKAKDFYWLLVNKTHTNSHAGPKRWEKSIISENICWNLIFQSIRETSKENKLREFHFKVIHRIFVTKKELFQIQDQGRRRLHLLWRNGFCRSFVN